MNVTLMVRTWFDKRNGNSYFTVRTVVDGNYEYPATRMVYGHGWAAYCTEAVLVINEIGAQNFPTELNDLLLKHNVIIDEVIVQNRKHLHGNGFFKNGNKK